MEAYSAYGRGTGILLANGDIRKVEDLRRGNQLLTPDEQDCYVASVSIEVQPTYLITPVGGVPFVAGIDQVLYVTGTNGATVPVPVHYLLERAPQAYMARFSLTQKSVAIFTRRSNNTAPYIPPYIAGLVIGQGYLSVQRMKSIAKTAEHLNDLTTWKSWVASIADLHIVDAYNKNLTIVNKDGLSIRSDIAYDAVIPDTYKYQTIKQRYDLIAGLLDAQGEVTGNLGNTYLFNPPSIALVEDMKFLCRSVGLKVAEASSSDSQDENPGIKISGDVGNIPCRLQGRSNAWQGIDNVTALYNFRITPLGEAECYKFQVTGTGLYMLDSFLVGSCGQGVTDAEAANFAEDDEASPTGG